MPHSGAGTAQTLLLSPSRSTCVSPKLSINILFQHSKGGWGFEVRFRDFGSDAQLPHSKVDPPGDATQRTHPTRLCTEQFLNTGVPRS